MKLNHSTQKQFRAMFFNAMKQTSVMAILAFVCFMFLTIVEHDTYDPDNFRKSAHFFNDLRWNGIESPANLAFIGAGLLNAILCFNFAWSKKQSNVVLSLGMNKSDIYFAKILGGIVPMGITFLVAGIAETVSNVTSNYVVDNRFFAMAAFTMLQYFSVYILSFVLSSAVMANTGNVIEGTIFTLILGFFPMTLKAFLSHTFWQFTHGAYIMPVDKSYGTEWNWANPFEVFKNLEYEFMQTYFYNSSATPLSSISIEKWSGIISAIAYSVIIALLGYLGFKKRRNEICATWGRAKGLNEITGAAAGFYSAYLFGLYLLYNEHGNANALTYIACCGFFALAYIIFKLIFGYKRKKELKAAINRLPAYAIGFAAVFMIFGMGLFSYSSKIPEVSEIKSVSVTSPYYKLFDECLSGDSEYALKVPVYNKYHYMTYPDIDGSTYEPDLYMPTITYTSYTDIEKIVKIHESFIRDGKIKNNGAHSCASRVTITYTLNNGKKITRFYTETTEGTTLKLLALNDGDTFRQSLFNYLNNDFSFTYYQEDMFASEEGDYFDITDEIEYPDFKVNETYDFDYPNNSICYLATQPCYLFPTDMRSGYKLGYIEKDFYDAIITDLKNTTVSQHFNHTAEDEIGVLSFGLSYSSYMANDDYEYAEDIIIEENPVADGPDGMSYTTSWNINSGDIKSIVITKDMTNTIDYLEEHDLMKYFERSLTVQDIKSVKVATLSELCDGHYDNSELFPIFYGGYWTSQQMSMWVQSAEIYNHDNYLFDNINNEITDRNQIKELIENAVVFGYCPLNGKIVEITYKDGSVATALVRGE